ncbi:hypothetical protein [Cellulomonas sp. ATA003]|uniref:hypothetical protein n=1 Tax=Cellulomonas sp. ATA003 TaxID=3073064 RepID=UPI002873EB68|nr:hypothetical protein [Cellulomonas sp. ATA003]WNB86316.1 hypothetical protein REH70_03425 [Cellulomonas sp. ATA003]
MRLGPLTHAVARSRRADADEPGLPDVFQEAWSRRLPVLVHALTGRTVTPVPLTCADDLSDALGTSLDTRDRGHLWLLLAVLTGRLPDETTVVELARDAWFDAPTALWDALSVHTTSQSAGWTVRVADGEVLVDLAHTVSTGLTTGIQRVARETARRWFADHDCVAVSWSTDFQSIRELTTAERQRIQQGAAEEDTRARPEAAVVVPWRSTYLLPELAAEPARSARLLALARFSPNRTGVLGFDCVPLTSAETTQLGFSGVFAGNLAAVRHFEHVATISEAARVEYSGWTRMLDAIGVDGPTVTSVPLPVEAPTSTPADPRGGPRPVPGRTAAAGPGGRQPRAPQEPPGRPARRRAPVA